MEIFFQEKTVKKHNANLGTFNGNPSKWEFQLLVNQCHPHTLCTLALKDDAGIYSKRSLCVWYVWCLVRSELSTKSALEQLQREQAPATHPWANSHRVCQCSLPPSAQVMPCNALAALPSFALGRGGGCETLYALSGKDFSCGLRRQTACKWSMPCSASAHVQQRGLVSFAACCELSVLGGCRSSLTAAPAWSDPSPCQRQALACSFLWIRRERHIQGREELCVSVSQSQMCFFSVRDLRRAPTPPVWYGDPDGVAQHKVHTAHGAQQTQSIGVSPADCTSPGALGRGTLSTHQGQGCRVHLLSLRTAQVGQAAGQGGLTPSLLWGRMLHALLALALSVPYAPIWFFWRFWSQPGLIYARTEAFPL